MYFHINSYLYRLTHLLFFGRILLLFKCFKGRNSFKKYVTAEDKEKKLNSNVFKNLSQSIVKVKEDAKALVIKWPPLCNCD